MHCCLLGVVRQLWALWSTPGTDYYLLTKDNRDEIQKRLDNIKPPHDIHRLPGSIQNFSKWKASQLKSWLLYWSPICLNGILNKEHFDSYLLLVRGIPTLLKQTS